MLFRRSALLIVGVLAVTTSPGIPALSASGPNLATDQVHEFSFTGLSLFDGRSYVDGWEKIRIAVPKEVKCADHTSTYSRNCTFTIYASMETPLSGNPAAYQPPSYFNVSLSGETENNTALIVPANSSPLGTNWSSTQASIRSETSGTVNVRITNKGSGAAISDIPIQVLVRPKAEVDAENAAKAAAAKAEQDAIDKKEAERVASLLATKLTITCKAGSKSKKVVGDPPVCPKGYKNAMQSMPTFQAYSQCRLYKKRWGRSQAALQDGGRTLQLDGYGLGYTKLELSDADWNCVLTKLKAPAAVRNKISQTRALDGMVSARFSGIEAFWTYHPDSGLIITFTK